MKAQKLQSFVKYAGLYNLALAIGLLVPVIIRKMGLNVSDQVLADVIGVLLLYTAAVQYFASFDLRKYAWIIFWEGLLRWSASGLLIYFGTFGNIGLSAAGLGVIDLIIGIVYVVILPKSLGLQRSSLLRPY